MPPNLNLNKMLNQAHRNRSSERNGEGSVPILNAIDRAKELQNRGPRPPMASRNPQRPPMGMRPPSGRPSGSRLGENTPLNQQIRGPVPKYVSG